MKHIITSLLFLAVFHLELSAQSTFSWQNYYPGTEVDSIVFLSTNKSGPNWPTRKDSLKYSAVELDSINYLNGKISKFFMGKDFPLQDYSEYFLVYEIQKSIVDKEQIRQVVELFPKDTCSTIPVTRCPPDYRDCLVFYKKKKPVMAVKICFSCYSVVSTPSVDRIKCLGTPDSLKRLSDHWIKLGLIDMFERGK